MSAESTRRNVVIFGGSAYAEGDPVFAVAEQLGAACAREGWGVVNGGYGGTMLACSRGAAGASGHVVGIACDLFRGACNPYLSEMRRTPDLLARLGGLIELGDAYIALPGSTGTLAELALVWELMNKHLLPVRPLLCWGDFWRPVVSIFAHELVQDPRVAALGVVERRGELITFVDTVEDAVRAIRLGFEPSAAGR